MAQSSIIRIVAQISEKIVAQICKTIVAQVSSVLWGPSGTNLYLQLAKGVQAVYLLSALSIFCACKSTAVYVVYLKYTSQCRALEGASSYFALNSRGSALNSALAQ